MRPFAEWTLSQPAPKVLRVKGLTKREREVFMWLVQGKTNGEIGKILGIASNTVSKHLEHIFPKLGVASRIEAIQKAFEQFRSEQRQGYSHLLSESHPRADVVR